MAAISLNRRSVPLNIDADPQVSAIREIGLGDPAIYATKTDGGSLEIVSGQVRLKALLQVQGHATVQDIATGEQFDVQEVNGKLAILTVAITDVGLTRNAVVQKKGQQKAKPFYRQFAKSKY